MDWNQEIDNQNRTESTNQDSKWSGPFFRNVLNSFNSSVYGTQNLKQADYSNELFQSIPQAAQYGTITAIVLIIVIEFLFSKKEAFPDKNKFILQWPLPINSLGLSTFISFFIFILLLPILLSMIIIFSIYKCIVKLIILIKFSDTFVMMMNGIDTVWAIEEDNAKSIINVIAMIELDFQRDKRNLLQNLRKTVASKLFGSITICSKMLYRRSFHLGYYFWTTHKDNRINDYVRLENFGETDQYFVTQSEIEDFVSKKSNTELPHNNTASWEILVCDKPLQNTTTFPIVFRIHHSLGDGVALLKLLLNSIGCNKNKEWKHNSFNKSDEFWKALFYFINIFTIKNLLLKSYLFIVSARRFASILITIPQSLLNQVLRPPDSNALHGPPLNGNKIVTWISDDDESEGLVTKIKRIKKRFPGATFSDIILTSMSASYYKYFETVIGKEAIPDFITSVVPVRMDTSNLNVVKYKRNMIELENKFSVAMLTIPIKCDESENEYVSILKRLVQVRRETSSLRNSSDFHVNYGLMKIAGCILPKPILGPMMDSVQATLVVSNLPGPSDVYICNKYKLHKMAFFVPHRGTTGIGLTILSCNNKIQLGMMVDSALIGYNIDAKTILRGLFNEVEMLDKVTSKNTMPQENVRTETHKSISDKI